MPPKDKYTDPELRDEVKEELKQSDKGGQPGQWSARKAQMMAQEYKRRGGDYTTNKDQKDESQQNLSNWTDEEWQTKEGSGHAKKEDGTEKRYLPKKAWENMDEEEKEETDKKKQKESKQGKQYVENTGKAKQSRRKATKGSNGSAGGNDDAEEDDEDDNGEPDAAAKDDEDEDDFVDDGDQDEDEDALGQVDAEEEEDIEEEADTEAEGDDEGDDEGAKAGQKRKGGKQSNGSSKKQKDNSGKGKSNGTIGSKHMDATEPAPRGSADRLPKKGQQATWKAMPGYVDGEVVEVLTNGKNVDGKSVKASKEDPKIVLKSNSSGKICVHKPESCFYED